MHVLKSIAFALNVDVPAHLLEDLEACITCDEHSGLRVFGFIEVCPVHEL
jgi:hypothetical protein